LTKVRFFDKRVKNEFQERISFIGAALSLALIFIDIPGDCKLPMGGGSLLLLSVTYVFLWRRSNNLHEINLDIEGTTVTVKTADIFEQPEFKVIPFNEYFDTLVDDRIISKESLNGIFLNRYFPTSTAGIDEHIEKYPFDNDELLAENVGRRFGKKTRYSIGTICVYEEYLLAAFSKFDEGNRAVLTMPEYLGFLITFWDKVNRVYAQKSVSVPIFGSGITRIKEHKNISDEDLLKIMLWTFRISEMRFKYPAKLTIVIHKDKIDKINLLDIKSAKNGL
jgi:hypothetical protein